MSLTSRSLCWPSSKNGLAFLSCLPISTKKAVIGSFQVFTQAFVMTGGEPGDLTRFYVLYLFNKAFELYDMGYASAMAWILLVIVLVLTGVILRTSARVVYYESLKK